MTRRRGGTIVGQCIEPGCREDAIWDWSNAAERHAIEIRKRTYRCLKHANPAEWLRPENPRIETVLVATRLDGLPTHLFWVRGDHTTGNGFAHGSGYRAFANDVPEGTVLRVVATLEQPAEPLGASRPSPADRQEEQ